MNNEQQRSAIDEWQREGCALLPDFFSAAEMAPLAADFEAVFGTPQQHFDAQEQNAEQPGGFNLAQFKNFQNLPFDCSPALNLIAVHPRLIALAKAALGSDSVRLYQGQAWAKYTGEANYDQPFHCDFGNHTLTVPSADSQRNSITFIILVSDVTEGHGPTHYVPKTLSAPIAGIEEALTRPAGLTESLLPLSRSTAGAAGTLFAYGIDVYHRGTNLTAAHGHRYVVTACFKRADNLQIDYCAWPYHTRQPWQKLFAHATPEQLECFGVPLPGDSYWTPETLRLSALRWPGWDISPYQR